MQFSFPGRQVVAAVADRGIPSHAFGADGVGEPGYNR